MGTKHSKALYVSVPVFNQPKDEDLSRLLIVDEPPKTVAEKRTKAVAKFYTSLRFPDASMDIPFSE